MSFKKDYFFGKENEDKVLETIQNKFKDNIIKSVNNYEKYDYKGDKYYYELKSRNNKYEDYPTTLIPQSKVINNKIVFLFNFTDGLYYIRYRKKIFNNFELKEFCRNRRYDYNDKPQLYYFIPIEFLKKI